MKKKKKDIDTSQERIAKKKKKNVSESESNSQYSSSHETDRESDRESGKKGVSQKSHSTSSVENDNSNSDANDSHKSESQKSIKLKKKKNTRKKSSNSETSETEEKPVKRGTNENDESSKSEEEEYKRNRHKKKSKTSNEKKKKKKKLSNSEESENDSTDYKKEKKKDRAKLKRERSSSSDSSYTRGSHENEKKHYKNKKHNKRRDTKRTVSSSSNEFKKKRKKDKNDYHRRDKIKNKKRSSSVSSSSISSSSYERKKKYSDSLDDSSDYGHKMKREKHNARWKRERYKHKSRRYSSSSDRSRGRYKKRENEKNKYSEEKEYDPFDEDLNKDVEINENLIEYAKKKISKVTSEDIGRTGGIYIPPFKLERLQNEIKNKKSSAYQKNEWMKLKKKINNIVNKVNIDNIGEICYELFECNLIRGKGIFSRAILHAQLSSPAFTNVFTCLLCIVNSKFPNIGLLTIHRTILHFRRAYKRCDKIACFNSVKFIAHMINQRVLNEIVGLQLCSLLLQNITNDSVQVCTYFLAEVGQLYMNICRSGLDIIFDRLKDIIQEGNINIKTQYDIEKLWNYRKNYFKDFPTVLEDLDIISEDDKIVHEIDLLDETINNQEELNIFREVPYEQYEKEDQEWADISRELLDDDDNSRSKRKNKKGSDSDESSDSSKSESYTDSSTDSENDNKSGENNTSDESNDEEDENKEEIHDMTEQYLINLRKNIYLSIMSSLSFEECVHKLLKLTIKSGYEIEICNMLIDCCCMEKTFQKFYALQAERLCKLKTIYQENFEKCFENSYNTAHRLETAKLRNCSKFFAHLLYTDAISWRVFTLIKLTEEDTTSSTRIFIKILLQELTNNMGIKTFYFKINHPAISPFLSGLFPSDNSQNIRFSINFFTAIGLGALTSSMRKLLSAEGQ
ncbi:pre-mRNA-splicing factor CWC22, putative [Plasmodium chabaudi chabaudi]|uniref:Pre-mRNA-splicing factor CWC22, putative n=1 Tax=Plasmodium chabaudi chabaudi TaxID=31271 RepID=A0A4V0KDY3_PLACU|nr:pre-mRNA-splicing factor CWC22, putative [Plasmodium chabaudi chabaudi]VTZ71227.1 pre-mRNA-splicing factor CWC22, putative [Plasmodium chabaudi chabaudi]|eukprot:XP_016655051.1 cell cycle control protein, putative [Plasmodium chabaudi chabaudi]